jgi:hypothetical protein
MTLVEVVVNLDIEIDFRRSWRLFTINISTGISPDSMVSLRSTYLSYFLVNKRALVIVFNDLNLLATRGFDILSLYHDL